MGEVSTAPRIWPTLAELLPEIRAVISGSQHIVCMAHKDADADSLGSALAFATALRGWGKTVYPVVPDPRPQLLGHLPGFDQLTDIPEQVDAVLTFDCAALSRFGEKRALLEAGHPVVNIDHHVSNEAYGTINLIESHACATGEVVLRLLRALEVPITADVATNLYAAILTDTGGFRHENTTETSLQFAADLVRAGADPGWIALKTYKSRQFSTLRLEGLVVAAIQSELDGQLLWSQVTQEMLATTAADMQQAEGAIDQLQSVDTMKIAFILKETRPDLTKLSVRTRAPFDATDLCAPFGGGGHARAAGAELPVPLVQARQQVLRVARSMVATG